MPGAIPHLVAGGAMFIIGRLYYSSYFDGKEKFKERLLLAGVCLIFSLIPDFILAIYYTTNFSEFCTLLPIHNFVHLIFSPVAIIILIILKLKLNVKREPVWIIGLWCIIIHVVMDLIIQEHSFWL
jgi:hypothetical protein